MTTISTCYKWNSVPIVQCNSDKFDFTVLWYLYIYSCKCTLYQQSTLLLEWMQYTWFGWQQKLTKLSKVYICFKYEICEKALTCIEWVIYILSAAAYSHYNKYHSFCTIVEDTFWTVSCSASVTVRNPSDFTYCR